ncbi:hypothetical protein CCP4SC76_3920008 [Gammaproteobacteria bacterium]
MSETLGEPLAVEILAGPETLLTQRAYASKQNTSRAQQPA